MDLDLAWSLAVADVGKQAALEDALTVVAIIAHVGVVGVLQTEQLSLSLDAAGDVVVGELHDVAVFVIHFHNDVVDGIFAG